MRVSNRTPHAVVVDGQTFPPVMPAIRVLEGDPHVIEPMFGDEPPVPVVEAAGWEPAAVAAAAAEILADGAGLVIVPRMVLDALPPDSAALRVAAAPDTSPASVRRDESGRIIGVSRLVVRSPWGRQ